MSVLKHNLHLISIYALSCLRLPLFSYAMTACFNATYLFAWADSIFNVILSLISLPTANLEFRSFKILRFTVTVLKEFYLTYLFFNYHFVQVLLIQAVSQIIKIILVKKSSETTKVGKLTLFFVLDLAYVLLNYACVSTKLTIPQVIFGLFNLHFITYTILSCVVEDNSKAEVPWLEHNFFLNISKLIIFSYLSFNSDSIKRSIKLLVYGSTLKLNPKSTDTIFIFIKILLKALPNWALGQIIRMFVHKLDKQYKKQALFVQYRRFSARMIVESNLIDFKRERSAFSAVTSYLKAIGRSDAVGFSITLLLAEAVYDLAYLNLSLFNI